MHRLTFDSDAYPPLAPLPGHAVAGTWTLEVADVVGADEGRVVGWRLRIETVHAGAATRLRRCVSRTWINAM